MAAELAKGHQLFTVIDGAVVQFKCLKKIGFGQDSFGKIDNTCLEDDTKNYERGLRDPGEGSLEINYNDENTSHDRLLEVAEAGEKLTWYVGSGHTTDAPEISGNTVTLPTTRSWNEFVGYLNPAAPNDLEVEGLLSYTFSLVRTSKVTRTKRTIPTPP